MVKQSKTSGSVLLYSLLIISLITAIAITVSMIVVNELKLTGAAANATMAFYAAESGIERGLYNIKLERNDPARTLSNVLTDIRGFSDNNFYNNASYDNAATDSKTSEIKDEEIKQSQYVQIDYYDADDPLDLDAVPNEVVESIRILNSGNDLSSWAEVSWSAWNSSGELGISTSAKKVIGPTDLQGTGWPINLDVFDPAFGPVGYRLRVRSLFGDLSSISVDPYSTPNGQGTLITDLPSYLEVRSVGEKSKFKQSLTATVPWKLPLFSVYDYVIYSEGDIIKDIILSSLSYTSGTIEVENDNVTAGLCSGCAGSPGDCVDLGWLALSCNDNTVGCTIGADSYCSLPSANMYFELPISDTIPASDEYYISLRYKPQAVGNVSAEVLVSDPNKGDLGFVIGDSAVSDWTSCTISEGFSLSSAAGRTVTFTNLLAAQLDIDWYQISSYKVFDDCN